MRMIPNPEDEAKQGDAERRKNLDDLASCVEDIGYLAEKFHDDVLKFFYYMLEARLIELGGYAVYEYMMMKRI